jgi:endonuclease V-like protein UPF0215 family
MLIMKIKEEVRIIAWDDCSFRFRQKSVLIVGAVFRGGKLLDGLLSTKIRKDGMDATEKIIKSIKSSRHYDQLSLVMLDGISYAGFNLVDLGLLNKKTKLPVIAIQRKLPGIKKFSDAMKIFKDYKKRIAVVKKAGRFYRYRLPAGDVFYQKCGIGDDYCRKILEMTCIRSNVPEPLRVAHLIASGLSGESKGRA